MTCPQGNNAKAYVLQSLEDPVEREYREHLKGCSECCAQVEALLKDDTLAKQLRTVFNEQCGGDKANDCPDGHDSPFVSTLDRATIDIELLPGDQLTDRYRIIKSIGGKHAYVFHALDHELGQEVALKLVIVKPDRTDRALSQLRQELRLREPIHDFSHIIKTYDTHPCEYQGLSVILLAMEYAAGGSLRQWLEDPARNGNSRTEESLELFEQACEAVSVLHSAGIVHRDIKPDNILLCEHGGDRVVKLTDFGISFSMGNLLLESSDFCVNAGTLMYMAPEQFVGRAKDIGPRSDIYALGVVLFEILDGSPPFHGSPDEIKDKHLHHPPPKLAGENRKYAQIVNRCLRKNVQDRYANVKELLQDIQRLRRGYVPSVDVACANCGHINEDPRLVECDKCRRELPAEVFRPCHMCYGRVRRDQDDCPHCGKKGVAAYYLLEERKIQIEKLRDENPLDAIRLLESVFREGAGDYTSRAKELIGDLREKQKKIDGLEKKAQKATQTGEFEKALDVWAQVLDLIPRHRVASEERRRLEWLLDVLTRDGAKAEEHMKGAEFDQAEQLLEECLKTAPNYDGLRDRLRQCRHAKDLYKKTYEQACRLERQRLMAKANREIEKALECAPKSREALSLSKRLRSTIDRTSELVAKADHQISWAQFEAAKVTIDTIEQNQVDSRKTQNAKKRLAKVAEAYRAIMVDVDLALETKDLGKALGCIKAAAQLCPESVEVKEVMATVRELKKSMCRDIRKARTLLRAAEFSEARERVVCAQGIWRSHSVIVKITRAIERAEQTYGEALARARNHLGRREFKKASEACVQALKTCPNSPSAKNLSQEIQRIWWAKSGLQKKLEGIALPIFLIGIPLTIALFAIPGDLSFSLGRHLISEVLLKSMSAIATVLAFITIIAAESLVRW